ncbi:MAG: type I restriction enzyme HsdR N-terminal domain-containing protein [Armatimonadetes bacterium]|nr:type I restriction enzyme HsdR N-terminal domain-containing protein [Armatimonadota bacterium]
MGTRDEQLRVWLNLVVEREESIQSEADVDDCLWTTYPVAPLADKIPAPNRLLQILGYSADGVSYNKKIDFARGQGLLPDFVVSVKGKAVLVIEDKAPSIAVNDWITQVHAYFYKVDAPLGMIFNSRQAILLINTRLPELSRFRKKLEFEPILQASINDQPQIVQLLNYLAAPTSRSAMLSIAKRLAEQRLIEITKDGREQKRLKIISDRIAVIKAEPPDHLLAAIIANDDELKKIRSKPDEVRAAWQGRIAEPLRDGEIKLEGKHKGVVLAASYNSSTGLVKFAEYAPCKPAPAALNAIHTVDPNCKAINGWTWWKYYDNTTNEWRQLTTLRPTREKQD